MTDSTKLLKHLKVGDLSRRQFIQKAIAVGVTTTMATQLADTAFAATPKKGGHFKVGLGHGATTDTFDPGLTPDDYMAAVQGACRNYLTVVDNNDQITGELAESWEASPDAKTWVFNLRKGVEFHNGKTMTSSDVAASLQHHIGESSTSVAKGFMGAISSIKTDGNDTVIVELEAGNADFPYLVSDYHVAIVPEKDGKLDWETGMGTGGYIVEDFQPGISTTLKRNPNYWKEGHAHFDSIEMLSIHDVAARTSALLSGDLHSIDKVELRTVDLLARNEAIKIEETQGALHFVYAMLVDREPFTNVDVRLAMKYGIDRQEFLDKILFGHGYVGNDTPIGKSNKYYADLEQRSYDPDRAKYHLKKAGLDKIEVSLSAASTAFDGAVDGALLYRESAALAGIDLTVVREPADGYWSDVWGVKPWFAGYWSGRLTEDWMFSTVYANGVPWNETHWANERFNSLLVQARAELNEDKRREMYREMQQLCADDCGAVIPAFGNFVFANSKGVAHGNMSAAWNMDGYRFAERWWFDS